MKLTAYPKSEPSKRAWAWRLLLGPAALLDGLVKNALRVEIDRLTFN